MNMRSQSRRRWLIGVVAAIAAAGVAVRELPLLRVHHYRRSRYDDLLAKLVNRDASTRFGKALVVSGAPPKSGAIATLLRARLKHADLRSVAREELAEGKLLPAGGWIVPESLALICALAARET
jgi:hypothetical protein